MPRLKLTDAAVARIKPPAAGRAEYYDIYLPGFGLRVSDKGTKSWVLFFRVDGKQFRLTLGRYPALSLAAAREAAREALEQADKGIDPTRERKLAKRHRAKMPMTFEAVAALFIERYSKRQKRTWKEDERLLVKNVIPSWGHRPLGTIKKSEVVSLLDTIEDEHGLYTANRTLAVIRKLFNWAVVERDLLEATPIVPGMSRGREAKRERVLTDDELKAVWNAADTIGWPFGPYVKVLTLTGQRRNEVTGMKWSELDLEAKLWTIPAERAKATRDPRPHEVPLSNAVIEIIKGLPQITTEDGNKVDHVFTSERRGDTPLSGFSRVKKTLDKHSNVRGWRFHDIRRTVATNMTGAGISRLVVSRVLNHAEGGVTSIYDRHQYRDEKRRALETWAARLAIILTGHDDEKVIPIRG